MNESKLHIIRNYYPGDKWLFVKIYGGLVICDRLLVSTIYPLMVRLERSGVINRWFFIRYSDPNYHLRIRVEIINPDYMSVVIQEFNKKLAPLCRERLLHKFMIDTYEREIERYCKHNMDMTESLFYLDSICTCSIIQLLMKQRLEHQRWKLSFVIVDVLLDIMNYSVEKKRNTTRLIKDGYQDEFGFDKHNVKQLAACYRTLKKDILSIFDTTNDLYGCRKIINKYQSNLKRLIKDKDISTMSVSSLLHMSMNRLFASKNRLNELMVYYCLDKYYQTEILRNKNQ